MPEGWLLSVASKLRPDLAGDTIGAVTVENQSESKKDSKQLRPNLLESGLANLDDSLLGPQWKEILREYISECKEEIEGRFSGMAGETVREAKNRSLRRGP